jgi:hypothetical protein
VLGGADPSRLRAAGRGDAVGEPAQGGAFSESWASDTPVGPGRTDPPLDPSDEGCDRGGEASLVGSSSRRHRRQRLETIGYPEQRIDPCIQAALKGTYMLSEASKLLATITKTLWAYIQVQACTTIS